KQHRKKIDEQEILFDKMSRQLVEMKNNVLRLQEKILEKETKVSELEGCVSNKDVEIEKCLERLDECENKLHKIEQTNQTIHMIMPSRDTLYNGRKGIDTFSSVRRPKHSGVIWKKKESSNTSNVDLSFIVQIYLWINDSGCSKHMTGLPKMKFEKYHLFSACEQGKIHRKHHKSKTTFASTKLLYLLHMDLCGPMCVESINGKQYVLVVIDDYSRYTWVFFLHYKDEASEEFKNKTLAKFFNEVGITQQFSAARTPQQNGVVERRNRTLVEAARAMLTFANLPLFLWAEAIATAYFTQNRSIIHKRFDKTPYKLMNKRKPNIKFLRVFGCRCYLLNDHEDVGKLKAKGDIGVFVGYSKESAAF
nr:retrovirus-related Pol polyprotein from transposon TNT 1-94 [Tanacetum cinerariifolium]